MANPKMGRSGLRPDQKITGKDACPTSPDAGTNQGRSGLRPGQNEQIAYEALGIKPENVFAQKWYDDRLVVVTRDGRKLTYKFN